MPEEPPALHVEGHDDKHVICNLLLRHGVVLDKTLGPVIVKPAGSDAAVLDLMDTATRASTNRPVGFVLDANGAVSARWQAVCGRLRNVGLTLPGAPAPGGFIGTADRFKARVGVWIMPDNATDAGNLESLLRTLVPEGDPLVDHADAATGRAVELGAAFPGPDRKKAVLHCWLAWQQEPGRPFGTALKAHFFRHDSKPALRFVAWFRSLYDV